MFAIRSLHMCRQTSTRIRVGSHLLCPIGVLDAQKWSHIYIYICCILDIVVVIISGRQHTRASVLGWSSLCDSYVLFPAHRPFAPDLGRFGPTEWGSPSSAIWPPINQAPCRPPKAQADNFNEKRSPLLSLWSSLLETPRKSCFSKTDRQTERRKDWLHYKSNMKPCAKWNATSAAFWSISFIIEAFIYWTRIALSVRFSKRQLVSSVSKCLGSGFLLKDVVRSSI